MDYLKLKEGHPLQTKEGPGTFKKYKQNTNDQNVLVKLDCKKEPKWFKEKDVNECGI